MRRAALIRRSTPKRSAFTPASPEQREAVKDRTCVNCGRSPVDPAHLTPRSQGGCDDALCVLPLCRTCHVGLDRREGPAETLDLAPVLALAEFAAERAHMASHMSFHRCIHRLTGERQ
jgi:hypothetical protein